MEESKEKLLKAIRHYQDSLERHTKTGITEKLLHAIEKLSRLPIKVCHLEETGIGRTVNGLKKIEGKVGEKARSLVDQWKSMVKGEEDAEQEKMGKAEKELPAPEIDENVENEPIDEDPDPQSLQICDEEEQNEKAKPSYKEVTYSSHIKSTNTSKEKYDTNDRNSKSRGSSDSESDTNQKSKKIKYDSDSHEKGKKSIHKSRRHSSDSESQSDSDSEGSESEGNSSSSHKINRKSSRRNSSASSNRSSSDSDNSSEDNSSSDRDSKKNKYKKPHSDRKSNRNHSSDSNDSNSDTEARKKHSKSKEKSSKDKERETYKKHSKSSSDSDKDRQSKSRDSYHDSKDRSDSSKSKERPHESKDRHSKSKESRESKHEKSYKEKESNSKKDSSSSKSKSKHEETDTKHKKDSKEPEKSKSKSDSDRDGKKTSKSDKFKESNGHSDSKKSLKSHKDKEGGSKDSNEKKRVRELSEDRESKKHKNSDSKDFKSKSHASSSSSKSKDKESTELKKDNEHKKEKEKDKKERVDNDKSKRDSAGSSSSSGGSKTTKDKDKTKTTSISKPKTAPKQFPIIIDSESGASFADVLGMLEAPVFSKTKKKSSGVVLTQEKTVSDRSSTSSKGDKASSSTSISNGRASSSKDTAEVPKLLKDPGELEPLDINMTSLLPSITPNYRPLSMPLDNNQHRKMWSDDEALTRVINAKHQRTKVYSGNKVTYTKVPTLFDLCSRILQDNIDALEYTGGVPYSILKPIIEKANPDQLFQLEFHNPYLIEDSDELWLLHCQKEFRTKKREEMESWREMYLRCLDEREAKLKALTANIKQSQDVKLPVRTTKLAYLDTAVKPPRNIARKQAKNGTAVDNKRPSQTPTERLNQLAKSGEAGKIAVPNPGKVASERSSSSSSHSSSSHFKPKKAPLMAKTLSLLKNRYGRR